MNELRLSLVMRLRGVPASLAAAPDAGAVARCHECRMRSLCDEALAAGDPRAFGLFCPNTHYIQQVRGQTPYST